MAQSVLKKSDRNTLVGLGVVLGAGALLMTAFAGPGALYPVLGLLFFALFVLVLYFGRLQRNETAELRSEIQGMLFVHQQLQPATPLPKSSNASISWEAAALLVSEVLRRAPGLVVELGAGVSTVLVAEALRRNGRGRLVTVEHDDFWAGHTRRELARRGLEAWAEVRHAPLAPLHLGDGEQPWYTLDAIQDLAEIDLLIVDGPPRRVAPLARYPALPVLHGKLADGALVFVDDANRASETQMLYRWDAEGLGRAERLQTKTGTALVRPLEAAR